jgi:type I restriction enzyme, S subunit
MGEIGIFIRGRRFTKADVVPDGIPSIHYGEIYTHYGVAAKSARSHVRRDLADKLRFAEPGDVVIAAVGETVEDVAKAVAWLGSESVAIHDDTFLFRSALNPKFVSYFMRTSGFHAQKNKYVARAKVKRLSGESLAKIRMPVPPLGVQAEIVRILDRFTELEAGLQAELKAELEARRRQHAYYFQSLLSSATETATWSSLGEVATVRIGQAPPPGVLSKVGPYPFINAGTTESGRASESNTPGGTITIPSRGQGGVGVVNYQHREFWCGPLCYRVNSSSEALSTRFLYYYLKFVQPSIRDLQQTGGTPALNRKELVLVKVPIPALSEQDRAVAILEKLDALVSDLSFSLPAELTARRKQYIYYLDKLLTFEEAAL